MNNHISEAPPHQHRSCELCATDIFEAKPENWLNVHLIRIAAAFIFLAAAWIADDAARVYFHLAVSLIAGYDVALRGIRKVFTGKQLDMNFLITIAAVGAFLIGHSAEGAAVLLLFFIAETLEDYSGDRSRKAVEKLLRTIPDTAHVLRDGKMMRTHVHDVRKGDLIAVRPGENIPLDGRIVSGSTAVNEAPITGEASPVEKSEGDPVFAGSLNQNGYIEVSVEHESDESTLSKIKKLVEISEARQSQTERFVDKFARVYTPAVVALAVAVALVPHFLFGADFSDWLYRALVLLVVSCPCALAISTPVSMVSAITGASLRGVLVKGGVHLERLSGIKTFFFDKTGTLSTGKIMVSRVIPLAEGYDEAGILRIAASLEQGSEHAIAAAVLREAGARSLSLEKAEDFRALGGIGIEGRFEGKKYVLGSRRSGGNLGAEAGLAVSGVEENEETAIILSSEEKPLGIIALSDSLRHDAEKVVAGLKKNGISVFILTGDSEGAAAKVAADLGVDGYHSELLPEAKLEVIKNMTDQRPVVMVGDGINDAPALSMATVGIAVGGASDTALETADIVLMGNELSALNYIVKLSRRTVRIVKQNIALSAGIKLSLAVMALFGFVSLWSAVAIGDVGLTLAVVLNSMRLAAIGRA